jgi:hypothetical protein
LIECSSSIGSEVDMRWPFLLTVALTHFAAQQPQPENAQKPYVMFAITTQLQKEELGYNNIRYSILVEGSAVVDKEGRILPDRLKIKDLNLDAWGNANAVAIQKDEGIVFSILFSTIPLESANEFLQVSLQGWALSNHLAAPSITSDLTGKADWHKAVMRFTNGKRGLVKEDLAEDGAAVDKVIVYPVRTKFSKMYFGNDTTDCVISLKIPFGKEFDGKLDTETKKNIEAAIEKLSLNEKRHIAFFVRGSGEPIKRFVDNSAKKLTQDLGFKTFSVISTGR